MLRRFINRVCLRLLGQESAKLISGSPLQKYIDCSYLLPSRALLRLGTTYGGWLVPVNPGLTETALPETPNALALEIRCRAAGRKIVFLGGSIGGQKNLARWFEVIARAGSARWFFVQVGEIHRGTLTVEDLAALERAQAATPENLLLHEGYLPDDRAFNEVIATCDVIFAVYRDFRISSNMLGKAAHFYKPILVSDRYLIGERVRQYGIGSAVTEDDADAMLAGMEVITARPVPEKNFDLYCQHFSSDELATRLQNMLVNCLPKGVS